MALTSITPGPTPEQKGQGRLACPRLIEMVGIGGAGKSTLLRALNRGDPRIRKSEPPGKLGYIPALATLFFFWLPVYLRKYRGTRWFTWDEMRNICYLDVRLNHIRRQLRSSDVILALDPGSVYWLSSLREFGPEFAKDPLFLRWWDARLQEWSAALDMIVWIEAPNELLLQRVLARDEVHEAREQPAGTALEYFERYRLWYSRMVPEMASRGHARLFHFRSDELTTEQMVSEVLRTVDLRAA